MAFNAYDAVKKIAEYKTGWHTSDKAGDRAKADEYAKKAQDYYKQLRDNGYNDVADALTNTNDVGAKYIVDSFMQKNASPPTSSTPEVNDTSSITGKINDLYGIQRSDRGTMAKKYDTLEDYNYNHNPYESDIGKAIMEKYQYQGKTASDNAVASGGASNGGNIDSYASANANRQQLAFTDAGNQAILNDFNVRIGNAKDILNNLGVYQQNQDKGMQDTIGIHQTEEQRQFDNSETSKNNDVSRKKTISEVTGFAPNEWVDANNEFLDENGNLKAEYKNIDFSAIMANAKKNGNTKLYNQASVARAKKIFGNYAEYGKYDDGNYTLNGKQQTESGRQFDENAKLADKEIETTKELTKKEIEANERMNNSTNATNVTVAGINASAKSSDENEVTWEDEMKNLKITEDAETFMNTHVFPLWSKQEGTKEEVLDLIDKYKYDKDNNPNGYKFTKNDVSKLLPALGIENYSEWIEERTWYSSEVTEGDIENAIK